MPTLVWGCYPPPPHPLSVCPTDEQFVLKRVADSAIDIYAMVVVLSRYGGVWGSSGGPCCPPHPPPNMWGWLSSPPIPPQGVTVPGHGATHGAARAAPLRHLVPGGEGGPGDFWGDWGGETGGAGATPNRPIVPLQAHQRVLATLRPLPTESFRNLRGIARAVVESGGVVGPTPLGF